MNNFSGEEILRRIEEALAAVVEALSAFVSGAVETNLKPHGGGPVTEADRVVDQVLRKVLLRDGEGWLSEESKDEIDRLSKERVWVVDPIDGTLEFISGIPEWCVSVGWVENGQAVAGGICNPATRETFLGSLGTGLTYNGKPAHVSQRSALKGAVVLASRSEMNRGEWERFREAPFLVQPVGSIAYKLALVAAGRADATWTLSPRNEWDVAAGVALVEAAGGFVWDGAGSRVSLNKQRTLLPGLVAGNPNLKEEIACLLNPH